MQSLTRVGPHTGAHHLHAEDEGRHEDARAHGNGDHAEAEDAPVGLHVGGSASRPQQAQASEHEAFVTTESIRDVAQKEGT